MNRHASTPGKTIRRFGDRQLRAPLLRLFCFPHAGGGAASFRDWAGLSPAIEVCPIQLPGRGDRLHEAPATTIQEATDLLLLDLCDEMDLPFAFFGHSMGALLGYEAALWLQQHDMPGPDHLFVAGHAAPHCEHRLASYEVYSDDELLNTVIHLGSIPPQIIREPDLLAAILPALRADIQCCSSYHPPLGGTPLDCPITCFCGATDPLVTAAEMRCWQEQTRASCVLHTLPGEHFFLQRSLNRLRTEVVRTLTGVAAVACPAAHLAG
jgi:surfactin synthase thioesterase subunit